MTYGEFRDECNCINCGHCKYFRVNADMKCIDSLCKRLDHKKYSFSKFVFGSYNCGQNNGSICREFEPKSIWKWMYNNWDESFTDLRIAEIDKNGHRVITICIDHNWDVRYKVRYSDFADGTFIDNDGNLKWIRKEYYKRKKKSEKNPTGYVYCCEYRDGSIVYGANSPMDWELVERLEKELERKCA